VPRPCQRTRVPD
ncbi:hypothetical protein BN1723_020177, partial [Verticillium longisporum]